MSYHSDMFKEARRRRYQNDAVFHALVDNLAKAEQEGLIHVCDLYEIANTAEEVIHERRMRMFAETIPEKKFLSREERERLR